MHRVELSRVRWRMRGAWQWPSFGVAALAEAVLLNALPVWGDGPGGFWGGLLLAGCLNLIVVAVLAPLAGRLLRLRRPDLPRLIATDYAGTAFIALLFAGFLAGGLHNHGAIERDRQARAVSAFAVARFVKTQAPGFVHGLNQMDTLRMEQSMYRACVPGPVADRPLCLFVRTDQDPPSVTRDRERTPNDTYRSRGGFR
jgi:hypothetical protein